MAKTKVSAQEGTQKPETGGLVFGRINYLLMATGLIVLIIGFLLMTGGGSDDPNVFDEGIFSFRRITLAPIVVLIGFIIEGVAIMYRQKGAPKQNN